MGTPSRCLGERERRAPPFRWLLGMVVSWSPFEARYRRGAKRIDERLGLSKRRAVRILTCMLADVPGSIAFHQGSLERRYRSRPEPRYAVKRRKGVSPALLLLSENSGYELPSVSSRASTERTPSGASGPCAFRCRLESYAPNASRCPTTQSSRLEAPRPRTRRTMSSLVAYFPSRACEPASMIASTT